MDEYAFVSCTTVYIVIFGGGLIDTSRWFEGKKYANTHL